MCDNILQTHTLTDVGPPIASCDIDSAKFPLVCKEWHHDDEKYY